MGSSHSYLQNLDNADLTPVHWFEDGLCLEVGVPALNVHYALAAAGVAGKCSMTAYTQFDYTKMIKLPVGDLEFGVW